MIGQKQDKKNNTATCCFCGKEIEISKAVQIVVYPSQDNESQNLFAHKECIHKVLHPSVPRHSDLLPDDQNIK